MDKLQARVLLGSGPDPARENIDNRERKAKFKPSVSMSLLRSSGDNIETQNAVYMFLLK